MVPASSRLMTANRHWSILNSVLPAYASIMHSVERLLLTQTAPSQQRSETMKNLRALSFALGVGLALTFALGLVPALTMAQNARSIIGEWSGTLNPGAQHKKRIVVHISAAQDGSLSGTIDYPDQDTSGIEITAITYRKSILHFEISSGLIVYDGTMNQDNSRVAGTMNQAGESLNLTLTRTP